MKKSEEAANSPCDSEVTVKVDTKAGRYILEESWRNIWGTLQIYNIFLSREKAEKIRNLFCIFLGVPNDEQLEQTARDFEKKNS